MAQFDLYANPIRVGRQPYPLVVVLQSDLTDAGPERIVAPLVRRKAFASVAGRLAPVVTVGEVEFIVVVPELTAIAAKHLGKPSGTVAAHREALLAAIDFLFFGV